METIEQIKIDEGDYKAEVYLCTAGKLTWLYGRNIEDRPITKQEWEILRETIISGGTQKDWANTLFFHELSRIKDELSLKGFDFNGDTVPATVKNIIFNMAYNMGVSRFNPGKWPKFFKAISECNWNQAATEGKDSLWFNQVGRRSERLMNSLENIGE